MSLNEFFNMGGYAFHVWTSYGLTFVIMALLIILPMQKKKQLTRRIRKTSRRRSET